MVPSKLNDEGLERVKALGLWGVLSAWEHYHNAPWLLELLDIEEQERKTRSLQRRISSAQIGSFKLMADFDWAWCRMIDQNLVEELFTLEFLNEAMNVVLFGPNGTGKTMVSQNLAYQALLRGATVCFTTASAMLNDLASQESASCLQRRLKHYSSPTLLVIDEVGYLSYGNRHADLLFEVVSRRYQKRSIILTTNKAFEDWAEVFPNAGCVVTMVDRLLHKAEIVEIDADSYRLKEANERSSTRKSVPKKTGTKAKKRK